MWLLVLVLLTAMLGLAAWGIAELRRDAALERLLFGIEGEPETPEEDLSAGDYGMNRAARFRYRTALFLRTWPGRGIIAAMGAAAGYAGALAGGLDLQGALSISATAGLLAVLGGEWLLLRARAAQQRQIKRELPNALELMAAVMEGGLGFEAALAYLLRESDKTHPLYFDLGIVEEAMARGQRRSAALRVWARRSNIVEVTDVTSALIQAESTGSSVGRVLHHHARAMFRDNEADIGRRAERLPIRMLFPMLFTIFPAILVVAAMPSFLRVFRVLEDLLGKVTGG